MRISYSDDEDFGGQFELWQANCDRSLKGKAGQAELKQLEAALLALPDKRLIHGLLTNEEGGVCAVAAYAQHKGLDLSKYDPEGETDQVGVEAGMPRLVAWKVVEMNDMQFDSKWDSVACRSVDLTPDERYTKMLAWVRSLLVVEQSCER